MADHWHPRAGSFRLSGIDFNSNLRELAREAHSAGYVQERDRILDRARVQGLWQATEPVSEEQLGDALVTLGREGLDPRRVLAAFHGAHAERGWLWPKMSGRVELVVVALEKARAVKRSVQRELGIVRDRALRRPVTAAMLRARWAAPADSATWWRDSALLLVGFRALCRAGELRALKCSDLDWSIPDRVTLIKRVHKTDVTGRAPIRVPLDALPGDALCPVATLREWLRRRELWLREIRMLRADYADEGFVFPVLAGSLPGKILPLDAVSKMVKQLARQAGTSEEGFSGHCLRIGGATAMHAAGKTDTEIQVVGGWTSDNFRRYLRSEELVNDGLSRLMLAAGL